MNILLLEPFFTGSHATWAKGLQQHSQHNIHILSLSGRYWKWRMHGGAVTLARQFMALDQKVDLILATDMVDLTTFLALTRKKTKDLPVAVYFHENQLTYPWSPTDQDTKLKRDNHYSYINFTTALAADQVFFNSQYHLNSFLEALPTFLKQFPDHQEVAAVVEIAKKSQVLHLGMDLQKLDAFQTAEQEKGEVPLILWNHRWEYDKNPADFFQTLFQLAAQALPFELVVLGEHYRKVPPIFEEAKQRLSKQIVQWGYAESWEDYAKWLWKADILPVTSRQDFFGGSVVEAMYCNCYPLLPFRLAYPEHLPTALHKQYFHHSNQELQFQLRQLLQHNNTLRKVNPQQHVQQYDWHHAVKNYDRQFDYLLAQKHS